SPMSWVKRLVGSRPFQKTTGVVAAEYLRLVWNTTRFVFEPDGIYDQVDRDAPVILAMWHGQHFLTPFVRRAQDRAKVLVSRHRDGEINALAVERLGIGAIRGSGHHGGGFIGKAGVSAFKEMLSALEQGYNVALTADIPKVARVAGLGIVKLARASGRPIYPIAIATRRRVELNNWDHTAINLPFGRGGGVASEPLRVPADADGAALEAARRALEAALNAATARAYAIADRPREDGGRGWPVSADAARLSAADRGGDAARAGAHLASAQARQGARRAPQRTLRRKRGRATARPAGVGPRRQRRRAALRDSVDRTHQRKGIRRVVHVGHRHLGQSRRTTLAQGRDPPIRDSRHAALRQALHRSLAARSRALRRVGSVAQLDRDERRARHSLDPDQRPRLGALVQSLATRSRHDRRAAALLRPLPRAIGRPCRALPRARSAARHHHRQSQVRRAGAARRPRRPGSPADGGRRTHRHRRSLDPCRRGNDVDRGAPAAARIFPPAAHGGRAASSRPRPRDPRDRACRRPRGGAALARGIAARGHRRLCRRHAGRARSDLPARADRVRRRLARYPWRPESDRANQAGGGGFSPPPRFGIFGNFTRAPPSGRGRRGERRGGARAAGGRLARGRARPRGGDHRRARNRGHARWRARAHARRARTLSHADSSRIPRVPCVSRRSGGARPPSRPPCSRRWRRSTARWRKRASPNAAAAPARRWSASAISQSAAPARRRRRWRWRVCWRRRASGRSSSAAARAAPLRAPSWSIRHGIVRKMWATSRSCSRARRRPSWRGTASRAPPSPLARASSSWTTGSTIPRSPRTLRCSWSTPDAASATAGSSRPVRCGRRSMRRSRAPTRWCSSA